MVYMSSNRKIFKIKPEFIKNYADETYAKYYDTGDYSNIRVYAYQVLMVCVKLSDVNKYDFPRIEMYIDESSNNYIHTDKLPDNKLSEIIDIKFISEYRNSTIAEIVKKVTSIERFLNNKSYNDIKDKLQNKKVQKDTVIFIDKNDVFIIRENELVCYNPITNRYVLSENGIKKKNLTKEYLVDHAIPNERKKK